jgi:GNAT superfamily N-acetyltransferase
LWGIFGKHHYLSAEFNKAAKLYLVYWNDVLVAMNSVLPLFCGTSKFSYRSHRLVVLPDYQGLGIGTKINDFFGQYYTSMGCKYFIRTTHVRLRNYMENRGEWKPTASNGKLRKNINDGNPSKVSYDDKRIAGSFEYVGKDYTTKEHKVIVIDDGSTIAKDQLAELQERYYLIVATGRPKEENQWERWCKELGIRTEMLYFTKGGKLLKNNRFEGCEAM